MMIEKDLCGEFGRLIRGRFRDEYRKSVAKILREKFAEVSEIKRQRDEVTDELTDVLRKLGVSSSAEVTEAIEKPSADEIIAAALTEMPEIAAVEGNEVFRGLVESGVSIRDAYKVVTFDSAVAEAEERGRSEFAAELRLNGGRPAEAGALGSGYGAIIASAASLTREEREDIARRAAGGERIAL